MPESREKESGRVAFDARGNPVWEWRTGEGTFHRDASTTLVQKLEAPARPPMRPAASPSGSGSGLLQKLRSWMGGKGSSRPR